MKTLLVSHTGESSWDSCRDINRGLETFYSHLYSDLHFAKIKEGEDGALELQRIYQQLLPDQIIITDHRIRLPQALYHLRKEDLNLSVHVFGCFLDRMIEWCFLEEHFSKNNVRFITASETYKSLCEKTLKIDRALVLPFPVLDEKFPALKGKAENEPKRILYAGRISSGKNVLALCKLMPVLRKELNGPVQLIVIGPIDDMGWQFEDKKNILGAMSFQFGNALEEVNKEEDLVHYIPHTDDKEFLYQLYEQSDCVVSLSTMKNEDYGMAIADAIALNKNVVCSSWGGHRTLLKLSENAWGIRVKRTEDGYQMKKREVLDALLESLKIAPTKSSNVLSPKMLLEKYSKDFEAWPKFNGVSKLGKFLQQTQAKILPQDQLSQKIYEVFHD